MPLAGRDQVRQKRLGPVDDTPEVDVHDALEVLELRAFDVAGEGDAGIVDDDVDGTEGRRDVIGIAQHMLALGDVEVIGTRLAPDGLDESPVSSSPASSTSLIASRAPRRPTLTASARPIPEPAPVTTTTWPGMRVMTFSIPDTHSI